jgi:predicted transcriptional regulator
MVSFGIPAELKEALDRWADEEERSLSWLLRRIVREAITQHEKVVPSEAETVEA